jgi:hypothetical protein
MGIGGFAGSRLRSVLADLARVTERTDEPEGVPALNPELEALDLMNRRIMGAHDLLGIDVRPGQNGECGASADDCDQG